MSAGTDSTSARWATSTWRDEASGWIERELRERGLTRTGEIEQPRIRFWSTQLTVPTDTGRLWFKENCPEQAYEARLVAVLARLVPDHVVEPLAVEPERGWLLTPDAGPTLRRAHRDRIRHDRADADRVGLWVRLVASWADLQRRVSPYADRLAAAGVPVNPPSDLPGLIAERVEEYAALPPDDRGHLAADDARRLRAAIPTVRAWSEQVAGLGLPLTLDHNDLHDANAFAPRPGEKHPRFFDFADSVVGHPLGSLLVALDVLAGEREADLADPAVRRVSDAYLEVWSDLADPADLRAAVYPARQLARTHRSECWRRVLRSADAEERAEWADAPTAWLTALLDHPTFST